MCSSAWEEQEGATHSLQAAADGFTGRGHKARFRSQGGALPGRGDEVRTHPSRGGWGPGELQLDHCSRGAKGTPRKANLKGNTFDWLLLVEHLLCVELSLGSGDMVMNTKDTFAFMEQTLW